ncbi:hypothetical protein COCNU_scaffold004995G000020 [Cocos nucifera]|nr:hypothetical protein [Cocos nucifera]
MSHEPSSNHHFRRPLWTSSFARSFTRELMVFDLDASGSPMVTWVAGPDSQNLELGWRAATYENDCSIRHLQARRSGRAKDVLVGERIESVQLQLQDFVDRDQPPLRGSDGTVAVDFKHLLVRAAEEAAGSLVLSKSISRGICGFDRQDRATIQLHERQTAPNRM